MSATLSKHRSTAVLAFLGFGLAVAVVFRLMVGGNGLSLPSDAIVWELRGQRAGLGLVVGGCLGLSGVLLQALLRNPLASPDLVGATSGASLGVMLSYWLGAVAGGGGALLGEAGPALVGALLALGIVGLLGQRRGLIDPVSLILVGVIVSLVCGAGGLLLQQQMPDRGFIAGRWMLGVLSDDTPRLRLVGVAVLLACSLAWAMRAGPTMDAASMSDDEARSVGVRLGRLRGTQFVLGGADRLCGIGLPARGPPADRAIASAACARLGDRGRDAGHRGRRDGQGDRSRRRTIANRRADHHPRRAGVHPDAAEVAPLTAETVSR